MDERIAWMDVGMIGEDSSGLEFAEVEGRGGCEGMWSVVVDNLWIKVFDAGKAPAFWYGIAKKVPGFDGLNWVAVFLFGVFFVYKNGDAVPRFVKLVGEVLDAVFHTSLQGVE